MDQVLQSGRRKTRPWTAQDQIVAEVAAACGVSCREIGRALKRASNTVSERLNPSAAGSRLETARRRYSNNPETVREANRRWYQNNSEKVCKNRCVYRVNNPEKVQAANRRWYENNSEKARKNARAYREANPEKVREASLRYYKGNRDKAREHVRRRKTLQRAARRQSIHPVTRQQIDARFALWQRRCAFCGVDATHERNHGRERLTVDHVLALTKGGLDEAGNILPACSTCNSSKHDSPVEDWYRQQPWFTDARWRKIQRHCPAAVVGQLPLALAA
jgi:hypothetical protein